MKRGRKKGEKGGRKGDTEVRLGKQDKETAMEEGRALMISVVWNTLY